jgi:hypothetical protein
MTVSCQFPMVGRLGGRRCYRAPLMAAPALLLALRITAVVIVYPNAGLTPGGRLRRGAASGMAMLVIDIWTPRGIPSGPTAFGGDGGGDRRPRSIRDTLPGAFGALV